MASVLEFLLLGKISNEDIIAWLKGDSNTCVKGPLSELENVKQEFIPFFLNYLRDHTLHLLQSSKSATPSPAKTPSLKKLCKSIKRKNDSKKRQQLFGASPAGDVDDLKPLPSYVHSPNTSLDSPGGMMINQRGERSHSKGNNVRSSYAGQKSSPQCGSQRSPYCQQTPDQQRSRQKLSLGEFFSTPDHSHSWKKKSPHSGGRRESHGDNSPSPAMGHGRKSGGKRRQSNSPLVQTVTPKPVHENASPPVFSLASTFDFPPMDNNGQGQSRKSLDTIDTNVPQIACDTKISRVINFSNPDSNSVPQVTKERLKEVKRISPASCTPNTRRITPTLVKVDNCVSQNSAFLVPIEEKELQPAQFSSVQETCVHESNSTDSLTEERQLLKQEKERYQSHVPERGTNLPSATPTKASLEHSVSVVEIVEASVGEVTHQDQIDMLVQLYSHCLQQNLLPNLVVELYFLVQLLTARGGTGEEETFMYGNDLIEEHYFTSVHNTVYFAVSVLEHQKRYMKLLDKGTLRLLSENPRVAAFSPQLLNCIERLYEGAEVKKGPVYPRSPIGSVSFQADTDNRKSFPSDKSFHLFKRQRDGFYELIREWEASRMNPNYNMAEMFGTRVRSLVNVKTDLANYIHFARLFQSQLIAMCKGIGSVHTDGEEEDENMTLLTHLKKTNPEKFKRLQERFIKPLSVGGPCPLPSFPGIQEFFRDFIVVACNPTLNQHLSDTFAAKVMELNETLFSSHDDDDAVHGNGDEEEKDQFRSALLSLRLLGKFLGLVTFLPYQSPDRLPDTMEATYLAIRNRNQPPLDLFECLHVAMVTGSLTLTVPWLIEFLSMMDSMATKLDHFQLVLFLLLYIHRYTWDQLQEDLTYSNLMIIATISWLLENPVIPDGFFFSEVPDIVTQKLEGHFPSLASLDSRNFVDQSLFYTCCPYMGELKALLVEFAVGTSSKVCAVRKITPVSADIPLSQKSLTDRQLQLQMEENFFHNHPASMKRVVDFVADRTASNYIKKFRGSRLQDSITEGKDRVIRQLTGIKEGSPSSKLKDRVSQVTNKLAQELYNQVKIKVKKDAPSYCHERTPSLMSLLLPDDQSTVVIKMASEISERIANEKIWHWMNKHITIGMFQTEIQPDIEKLSKVLHQAETPADTVTSPVIQSGNQSREAGHVTASDHVVTLKHPSEVLIELKDIVKMLMVRKMQLEKESVDQILTSIKETLENRQDILPSVYRSFSQLTMELVLAILMHESSIYTQDLVDTCLSLWTGPLNVGGTLCHCFSGRVLQNLAEIKVTQPSLNQYKKLLTLLMDNGLLTVDHVQSTCLKFLPNVKEPLMLSIVCECLCHIAENLPAPERPDALGACLELLYTLLPSDTMPEALHILEVLGLTNNNVIGLDRNLNKLRV